MTKLKLSEVIRRCQTRVDRYDTDLLYYVAGEHFESGDIDLAGRGEIAGSTIGPMFYYGFKPGDFLLVSRNPHLRKASRVDFAGICSEKTFVLETADESILSSEYLPWVLQNDRFWDYAQENRHGSTNFFINWSTLADYVFELPPIEDQKRIATILWAAQSARRNYRKLLKACDDVVKSQFVEIFGDPIGNTTPRPRWSFSDLGKWQSGGTPARSNASYFEGDIDWYSAGELNGFHLQPSVEKITTEALSQSAAKLYPAGSLLVGMYDTAALKMGVLDRAAASNQACACLIPNELVLVEWLYTAISIMKPHLLAQRKGCRQKNLSLKMIKGFSLPIADKAEQKDFAAFFHSVDKSKFKLSICGGML